MSALLDRERLLKLKCPSCGSRDKNEVDIKNADGITTFGKIVTCNQCGHTTEYWVSALAKIHFVQGENFLTVEEYTEIVKKQHHKNHM